MGGDNKNKLSYFKSKFPDYYKATFVRNPWNRMVSAYYYQKQHNNIGSYKFHDFIKKNYTTRIVPFTEIIDCEVDFVGKMENFIDDFNKFCSIVGAKVDLENHPLERNKFKNKSKRPYDNYRKFYNKETRDIVAKKYKNDIERFNYEF
jgi:hypothetical protein